MDFEIPQELQRTLAELDDFIEREIRPLERADDNIRFFDHRREHARTDWDNQGLPRPEWEALLKAATRKADAVTILNDLHRGKNAGAAWKWLIDISAVIFLVLSLVGYILFFSLRHRLVQTMALTVVSLGALVGIFVLFVP